MRCWVASSGRRAVVATTVSTFSRPRFAIQIDQQSPFFGTRAGDPVRSGRAIVIPDTSGSGEAEGGFLFEAISSALQIKTVYPLALASSSTL